MNKFYVFLIALLINGGCMAQNTCNVSVFYIPIDLEFFQPPSIDYIKVHGGKINKKELNSVCNLLETVDKMQSKLKVSNENKSQRILIVNEESKDEYLITTDKQIIKNDYVYIIEEHIVDAAINEIVKNTTDFKAPKNK